MTNEEILVKTIAQILDRSVRIETRLTKLMERVGVDHGGSKPSWDDKQDCVVAASVGVALDDIALALPEDVHGEFEVKVKGVTLAYVKWVNRDLIQAARSQRLVQLIPDLQKKA